MSTQIFSDNDTYNLFLNDKIMDTQPLIKMELIVEISFETFGQVQYTDENGGKWIKEFSGKRWSKEILLKHHNEIEFCVFVNNQFLQKGGFVTLIKKINKKVLAQNEFQLSSDKLFDGWFKLIQ